MPELNDTTPSVAEIIASPEKYGFSWLEDQKVEKNGMQLKGVPLVKHNDVDLLTATFGKAFWIDSANGTSRHVTNQRIVRDARFENHNISVAALKQLIVENMLGQKSSRKRTVITETVFAALDGKTYPTLVEAQAASMAFMVDQQQS